MKLNSEMIEQLIKEEIVAEIGSRPKSAQNMMLFNQLVERHMSNLKQSLVGMIDENAESIAAEASLRWNLDIDPEVVQRKIFRRLAAYFTGLSNES